MKQSFLIILSIVLLLASPYTLSRSEKDVREQMQHASERISQLVNHALGVASKSDAEYEQHADSRNDGLLTDFFGSANEKGENLESDIGREAAEQSAKGNSAEAAALKFLQHYMNKKGGEDTKEIEKNIREAFGED